MNIVQIAGRLGRDAETRFTPSGLKVTNLTVATNVRRGGKEDTIWWRVTLWGDRFDKMLPYLKKGSAIIVVGEIGKPEIWTDKEGRPQATLELHAEIVRFNPFGGSGERPAAEQTSANAVQQTQAPGYQPADSFSVDSFGSSSYGAQAGQGEGQYVAHQNAGESLPF